MSFEMSKHDFNVYIHIPKENCFMSYLHFNIYLCFSKPLKLHISISVISMHMPNGREIKAPVGQS